MQYAISISVEGVKELTDVLDRIGHVLSGPEILDEAAATLLARTRARFLAETDPEGNPWIPSLAALRRARTGRGGGTLFDTGNLFHSIQLYADGPDSRQIGTDVEYGLIHQLGLGNHPVREFLGISADDTQVMVDLVRTRVIQALNA